MLKMKSRIDVLTYCKYHCSVLHCLLIHLLVLWISGCIRFQAPWSEQSTVGQIMVLANYVIVTSKMLCSLHGAWKRMQTLFLFLWMSFEIPSLSMASLCLLVGYSSFRNFYLVDIGKKLSW